MENTPAALTVQHLNKFYGHHQTLFDVNFQCQSGHIIGLVGANGAGKTTIMRSILGLAHHQGQILIGPDPVAFNHHNALNRVGALIESPGLYPYLTGREHLKLFVRNDGHAAATITTLINQLHMEKFIDERAKKYSLGMKQKLGIAIAFLNQPQLIILDEPLNGLDPQATHDLRALILKQSAAGTTFLISSHILGELQRLADDLIVINHGKVVKETTMADLLAQSQHRVQLTTNDDDLAVTLLQAANYHVSMGDGLLVDITATQSVEKIVQLLGDQQLLIQDIQHLDDDLEASILKIIAQPEAQHA